ncbi:MAG: PQQ-dependent sugar dehydrogenase [Bacteroidia bacterium]
MTEKPGSIRVVSNEKLLNKDVKNVPRVHARGQGGLLDIKLHPDYANNGWIYLAYSKPGTGAAATTITRAKLENNSLTNPEEIFIAQPYINSNVHFGWVCLTQMTISL